MWEETVCGQGTAYYILAYAEPDDVILIPHMWKAQHISGWGDSATYHWAWCCKRAHNLTAMTTGRYLGGAGHETTPGEKEFFADLAKAKKERKELDDEEAKSPWEI